jgi:hypothetical protein
MHEIQSLSRHTGRSAGRRSVPAITLSISLAGHDRWMTGWVLGAAARRDALDQHVWFAIEEARHRPATHRVTGVGTGWCDDPVQG